MSRRAQCEKIGWSRNALRLATGGSLLAFLCAALAQTDPVEITVDGVAGAFEVSLTEMLVRDAAGRERIEAVEPQAGLQALLLLAAGRLAESGEVCFPILHAAGRSEGDASRRVLTNEILVRSGAGAPALAEIEGVERIEEMEFAPGTWSVRVKAGENPLDVARVIERRPGVVSAEPQLGRLMQLKRAPNDPLFRYQTNFQRRVRRAGADLSIVSAWDRYDGEGVRIAVCDDGVELDHPDFEGNADKDLAFDFLANRPGGAPVSSEDAHGTSCAGLAAARANNGIGITGAAPAARLTSLRIVGNSASPADEARTMAWRRDVIGIKSNSWGPFDDGVAEALPAVVEAAMKNAVKTGRDGRGTIFVWAGGNGRTDGDNSNYDGYANSIYTIAIGAVSPHGGPAYYSEPGANLIASSPSDNRRLPGVTSTDLTGRDGYNGDLVRFAGDYADDDFTKTFGGTSAAAPQIAGVIALMLEANPRLGWRDVQEILIRTAVRNDRNNRRWMTNAAGLHFNELYGAGVVQASAATRMAGTWKNLPAQRVETVAVTGPLDIPDGSGTGRTLTFAVSNAIRSVEHVVVEADIEHPFRGDLEIELVSPGGTRSTLAEAHGDGTRDYNHFKFMSVRDWGERAAGTWSVIVRDRRGSYAGSIRGMKLVVHGTGAAARTGK